MTKTLLLFSLIIITVSSGCVKQYTDSSSTLSSSEVVSTDGPAAISTTKPAKHTLTVFAAASLTGAFQEIGKNFEAANPGVAVNFNFAGSQILRTQLEQGALADVFASADHMNLDLVVSENLIAGNTYQDFTSNILIVILPPDNPANVQALQDLANPNLKVVLADASVPAGNYARQLLLNMDKDPIYGADFSTKVLANVVSNETDVKQVVTKIELGEADAGIVYTSDSIASPDLSTISIPDNINVIARYPMAILTATPEPLLAAAFVDYVMSATGQAFLKKWGFNPGSK